MTKWPDEHIFTLLTGSSKLAGFAPRFAIFTEKTRATFSHQLPDVPRQSACEKTRGRRADYQLPKVLGHGDDSTATRRGS